jgi:hypothetical protein
VDRLIRHVRIVSPSAPALTTVDSSSANCREGGAWTVSAPSRYRAVHPPTGSDARQ